MADSWGNYIALGDRGPAQSDADADVPAQITSGHGPPPIPPLVSPSLYIDVDTGDKYWFYNGAWH